MEDKRLAAYRDEALCPEAANQLIEMLENPVYKRHKGEDLPIITQSETNNGSLLVLERK